MGTSASSNTRHEDDDDNESGDDGGVDENDEDIEDMLQHLDTGPWIINKNELNKYNNQHLFILVTINDYESLKNISLSLHQFRKINDFTITFFVFFHNNQITLNLNQKQEIDALARARQYRFNTLATTSNGFYFTHKKCLHTSTVNYLSFNRSSYIHLKDSQRIIFAFNKDDNTLVPDYILNCKTKQMSLWLEEPTCDIHDISANLHLYDVADWSKNSNQYTFCESIRKSFPWNPKCLITADQTTLNIIHINSQESFSDIVKLCNSCKALKGVNNILAFAVILKSTKHDKYIRKCLKGTLTENNNSTIGSFNINGMTFYATINMKKENGKNALEFPTHTIKFCFRNLSEETYSPNYIAGANFFPLPTSSTEADFRILNPLRAKTLVKYFLDNSSTKTFFNYCYSMEILPATPLELAQNSTLPKLQNIFLFSQLKDDSALVILNSLVQDYYQKNNFIVVFQNTTLNMNIIKKFFPNIEQNENIQIHFDTYAKQTKTLLVIIYNKLKHKIEFLLPPNSGELIFSVPRYVNSTTIFEQLWVHFGEEKNKNTPTFNVFCEIDNALIPTVKHVNYRRYNYLQNNTIFQNHNHHFTIVGQSPSKSMNLLVPSGQVDTNTDHMIIFVRTKEIAKDYIDILDVINYEDKYFTIIIKTLELIKIEEIEKIIQRKQFVKMYEFFRTNNTQSSYLYVISSVKTLWNREQQLLTINFVGDSNQKLDIEFDMSKDTGLLILADGQILPFTADILIPKLRVASEKEHEPSLQPTCKISSGEYLGIQLTKMQQIKLLDNKSIGLFHNDQYVHIFKYLLNLPTITINEQYFSQFLGKKNLRL
nr:hypothetical protein [Microctonus hyperodae filamentous virus]